MSISGDGGKKKPVVFIRTFGCQMNMYDTEVAEGILEHAGFEIVRDGEGANSVIASLPATKLGGRAKQSRGSEIASSPTAPRNDGVSADVMLMNTCSVREHAEERVYGRLGMLGKAKKKNPDLVIGLMGCMPEEHRERLFKRFPQLDFMVGTRNIRDLPDLIHEVIAKRSQVSRIEKDGISIEYTDRIKRRDRFHAWLPIMAGCDKVCTFCIVPLTRGREVSVPAREVCREAKRLVSEGVKWITLLGQNVNSYKGQGARGKGQGESPASFPELLEMLCQIEELERISFTTSHPQDATEELFHVIARNPKISRRFHLPLQSGSDRMLKKMKRLHAYADYKEKIDKMRELIAGVVVTTDVMAGFSGEAEEDHQATIRALDEIRFESAFIYKYSLRPGTPASKLPDDVPWSVKEERNGELLEIQRRITNEIQREWIGRTIEVFVEGLSPKDPCQLLGRAHNEKKVVFLGDRHLLGSFQKVKIEALRANTFVGRLVSLIES